MANNYTVKDGNGSTVNFNSVQTANGNQTTLHVESDPTGVLYSNTYGLPVGLVIAGGLISNTNPLPILDGFLPPVASSWTTGTTVGSTLSYNTNGYDTVIVTLVASASCTGGVLIFEVYDGATWLPIKAPSIIDYTTVGSVTLSSSYSKAFQVPVAGFAQFRSRLTSAITGTSATLTITHIVSSAPDTSLVTVGLDPGSPLPAGTNTLGAVYNANPSTIIAARQTATTSAVALPSTALVNGINLTSLANNTGTIYIGSSGVTTSTGYPLVGGQSMSYAVTNLNAIYMIGTNTTDVLAYTGN